MVNLIIDLTNYQRSISYYLCDFF